MFLRIFSALTGAALIHGCTTESPTPEGDKIDCAIGSGAEYSKVCTLEKAGNGEYLIHSPDGGFRRLMLLPQSGEFAAVDGADTLNMLSQDSAIAEFEIGGDRYRIPHRLVSAESQ
ncbi:MAG: hypothetical protein QNJ15_09970 [Erythrobacter sp.]|nr:hypothetical protein [Erythrobacter sp.]